MRLKSELYKKEQEEIVDKIIKILDLEKQKLFLDNLPKEHQILMNSALSIEGEHIQMIHLKKE